MRARVTSIASLAALLSLSGTAPSAQSVRVPRELIDGQVLGWIKIYDYKGATLPIKQDQRVYSPAQLSVAQLFANWMQASYLPTGALGDVFQIRNEKLGLYNQKTAAQPQSYGAFAKLYDQLKYGVNKKIEPLTADSFVWSIEANGTFGVVAYAVSTPERYYFTLPTFAQQGFGDDLEKAVDLSRHPVLGRFPAFFMRNSATGNRKYVLLSKDRRLPFVTITKGEYLDANNLEDQLLIIANQNNVRFRPDDTGNTLATCCAIAPFVRPRPCAVRKMSNVTIAAVARQ
jgi:hypothetical protein